MIKKLRIKFVCIVMTITMLMVGVILGVVIHFTGTSMEMQSISMMRTIASTPFQQGMPGKPMDDEVRLPFFTVQISSRGELITAGGGKYTATITEIGNTGVSNGCNSKYTVELTMDRAENMLSGMNATATIVLSTANDVLTIPADALVENGNLTVVYTGYDEENDLLLDPVTVLVGCSDGETVEILQGLTSGQTYYYAYYDTLEISLTPDFGDGVCRRAD